MKYTHSKCVTLYNNFLTKWLSSLEISIYGVNYQSGVRRNTLHCAIYRASMRNKPVDFASRNYGSSQEYTLKRHSKYFAAIPKI